MKKLFILILSSLSLSVFSQEEIIYKESRINEIVEYVIQVSTEHFTEEELKIPRTYSTYFSNTYYSIFHNWKDIDSIQISNDEGFNMIKSSLLMLGRQQNSFDQYKNYCGFSFDDGITIVLVFSDFLKNDFEEWVKPGNLVKFYLQLASYELGTKTMIFIVNKYDVWENS